MTAAVATPGVGLLAATWGTLLSLAGKVTLVVLTTAGVVGVLRVRRASAAVRHRAWVLGIGVLALLPIATLLIPRWDVPRLAFLERLAQTSHADGGAAPAPTPGDARASAAAAPAWPLRGPNAGVTGVPAEPAGAREATVAEHVAQRVVALYGAGVLAALAWLGAGYVGVRRAAARAEIVSDPAWLALLGDCAWLLETRRPITLLRSPTSPMPMTWGVWRPRVLLPAEADRWSDEERRAVLLHEVAHVARHDCLTQALAGLACALYWWHPGAWYAARRLRVERELACDDRVVTAGTRPRAYAAHLLEIARGLPGPRLLGAAALSMARPSQLEGRLLAVLDPRRNRGEMTRPAAVASALATLLLALPLAAARPGRPVPQDAGGAGAEAARGAAVPAADPAVPSREVLDDGGTVEPGAGAPVIERLVRVAFGGALTVEARTRADVRIHGWDRDAVQVRVWGASDARAPEARPAERVVLQPVAHGVRLVVAPDGNPGVAAGSEGAQHIEVRVPRRFDLVLHGGGAPVEVRDVHGRMTGTTQGGALTITGASGVVSLATAGGAARLLASQLSGGLSTGAGVARLRDHTGDLDVHAAVAEVEGRDAAGWPTTRRYPGGVRAVAGLGRVAVDQYAGAVVVAGAPDGLDVRTGRGEVVIGSVAGLATVRTGGGDVTIRALDGAADVETARGAVYVRATEARDVSVRTGGGAVTLVLPPDFNGRIDAAAQADAAGRLGRITSEFPLRTAPERGAGASRQRLATGRVGTGAQRVRVTAVGGDVRIRREPVPR